MQSVPPFSLSAPLTSVSVPVLVNTQLTIIANILLCRNTTFVAGTSYSNSYVYCESNHIILLILGAPKLFERKPHFYLHVYT